jgi:arylsulfatase
LWIAVATFSHGPACGQENASPPNFVFIIADDVSWDDLGCYGNKVVSTPNLDQLAKEGLVFDNAYLTTSSCSPTRCSIITGRYPHNTGAPELHLPLPAGHFMFPDALHQAGYYTVLSGKHHMGPEVNPAFDVVNKGGGPGGERLWVRMLRDRPKDRPFFCWFASKDAHRPWQQSPNVPTYDPEKLQLPPYLFDGPETRQDLAHYYHEVSRLDYFVGQVRDELDRQGLAASTYIVFCSDNGRPFPRCKTRLYDCGVKTPLIVWSPQHVRPARTNSLVSVIDLAPTFLDLAGIDPDARLQGVSLKKMFDDPAATVRDYAFAEHNWHVYLAHERMLRCGDWLYIRNAHPDRLAMCEESNDSFPAGKELAQAREENKDLSPAQFDIFLQPRPREELYRVSKDPDQLHNLADDSSYADTLAQLRQILDRWTTETGDTVPTNPTPDRVAKKVTRAELPGAAKNAASIRSPGPIRGETPN